MTTPMRSSGSELQIRQLLADVVNRRSLFSSILDRDGFALPPFLLSLYLVGFKNLEAS